MFQLDMTYYKDSICIYCLITYYTHIHEGIRWQKSLMGVSDVSFILRKIWMTTIYRYRWQIKGKKNPTVYGVSVMLREYVSAHINPMLKCFSFDTSGISQDAGRGWNTWAMKLWIRLWPLESPDLKQKVPCGGVWANMATTMVKIPI